MNNAGRTRRDLSAFHQEMSWDDRLALIKKVFPSCAGLDWNKELAADDDLAGRLLGDIAKAALASPGRSGPRPPLDQAKAGPMIEEWLGRDPTEGPYSVQSFPDALAGLMSRHRHSIRHLAERTDLQRNLIWRLLISEVPPSALVMKKVATVYNKQPAYFLEYRIGAIAAAIVHRLTTTPDQSIRSYERLFWSGAAV